MRCGTFPGPLCRPRWSRAVVNTCAGTRPRALNEALNRLRKIADKLDDAPKDIAASLEAYQIVSKRIVEHEREDEMVVYPRLNRSLGSNPALAAMSRAHRKILHLAATSVPADR
nr:hemerythrin domain-containing protein [Hyphomicrobium denitrificans]